MRVGVFVGLAFVGCVGIAGDVPRPGGGESGTGGAGPSEVDASGAAAGRAGSAVGGASGSGPGGAGRGGTGGSGGRGGAGASAGSSGNGGAGAIAGGGGAGGIDAGLAGTAGTGAVRDAGAIVDAGGRGGTGGTGPICDVQTGSATPVPDAPPQCTSGRKWTSGNGPTMSPGEICMGCHGFTIAGTVYPTLHETGLCYGINGGAEVVITPACGTPITLSVNSAGNFYYMGTVRAPFTAKVVVGGRERAMITPQTLGDCNACHTPNGIQGAPGRIIVP